MPFLLILSAILTALTGVVSGARPVDVQIARHARASTVADAAAAAVPSVLRHAHLIADFDAGAVFAHVVVQVVPLTPPRLYLDRLRA